MRPALTLKPRFMRKPESQPPPIEPTLETAVDDDQRILGMVEVEAVVVVEELGEIEEIEPPDGIGEAFGEKKATETRGGGRRME